MFKIISTLLVGGAAALALSCFSTDTRTTRSEAGLLAWTSPPLIYFPPADEVIILKAAAVEPVLPV